MKIISFFTIVFLRIMVFAHEGVVIPVCYQNNIDSVDSIRITFYYHYLLSTPDSGRFELDQFPNDTAGINDVIQTIYSWKNDCKLIYKKEIKSILTVQRAEFESFASPAKRIKMSKSGKIRKVVSESATLIFLTDKLGCYTEAKIKLHRYSIHWSTTPEQYKVEYHYDSNGRIDEVRTIMKQVGWSRNYQCSIEYFE